VLVKNDVFFKESYWVEQLSEANNCIEMCDPHVMRSSVTSTKLRVNFVTFGFNIRNLNWIGWFLEIAKGWENMCYFKFVFPPFWKANLSYYKSSALLYKAFSLLFFIEKDSEVLQEKIVSFSQTVGEQKDNDCKYKENGRELFEVLKSCIYIA